MLQDAVAQASLKGWRVIQFTPVQAVLIYEQKSADSNALAINIILSFITCGMWLIIWIPIMIIGLLLDPGTQMLILTQDRLGNITQVVQKGL